MASLVVTNSYTISYTLHVLGHGWSWILDPGLLDLDWKSYESYEYFYDYFTGWESPHVRTLSTTVALRLRVVFRERINQILI